MKQFIFLAFILLLATPIHAETYSWVDDSGTYNYTEDYSRVPKKYQRKVRRHESLSQNVKPQLSPNPGNTPVQPDNRDAKSAAIAEGENELYGGKSRAVWRKEMDALEEELSGIEQRSEQLRKQIYDAKGRFELLKKDYDDNRAAYDQKYKKYTELIEAIRKAGIAVEIKK